MPKAFPFLSRSATCIFTTTNKVTNGRRGQWNMLLVRACLSIAVLLGMELPMGVPRPGRS